MPNSDHVDTPDNNKGGKKALKDMTDGEKYQWAKEIINRMMAAWAVETHKSLAAKLGMNDKVANNWLQKLSVPFHPVHSCHLETGKTLDWLYYGQHPPVEITPPMYTAFKVSTDELLRAGESMGMIKVLEEGARDYFVTGMANGFLEISNTKKVDEQ
jgi:hypothetical protein